MSDYVEYIGVLRCRTYHTWPATESIQKDMFFQDGDTRRPTRITVLSLTPRTSPELYPEEEADKGTLLWNGQTKNLHRVRDLILKAPPDVIPIEMQYRKPYRGEIDICVQFRLESELRPSVVETVRTVAYSVMASINLQLSEHLVPTAPFQVLKFLGAGQKQMENTVNVGVFNRVSFEKKDVIPVLSQFAEVIAHERLGPRMLVALELYAAHLAETQARVRFLLLVIAIEAVAEPTPKHEVASALLSKWQEEVRGRLKDYEPGSDEYDSLIALEREMNHRKMDSIRGQVRNLFSNFGTSTEESKSLQKRALRVYDMRSTLVHEGHLPADQLSELEDEARELLEMVLKKWITDTEL